MIVGEVVILGYTRCAVHGCMTGAAMFAVSIPLCSEHVTAMRDHLAVAAPLGNAVRPAAPHDSLVYYAQFQPDIVKIGMTTSPLLRWEDLRKQYGQFTVLVVEPGNRRHEARRHREFKHVRLRGELFRFEPDLQEHVAALRTMHPDWRNIVQQVQDRDGRDRLVATP